MGIIADRRSIMTLFSSPTCFYSHRARLVMAEKNINVDIVNVEGPEMPEDLIDLNPYHSVPTLVDRDLVLYDSRVISEYLDERFPHPPLMPVDPVTRAQFRLALFRIEKDWFSMAEAIENSTEKRQATRAKKVLTESIIASVDVFELKPYFLSDDFSLVDCSIAPILWRLRSYGIDLSVDAKPIQQYMNRVFSRPSFQESLTELEHEMQQ
ncbi:MAG: glutathione S-transferase N-terminal domain-containing protein [Gammaproteobacteria bacterium]|jgi:RNA polymerase-associated protein|nr:stringent starvation protein A [Chromatiales bacterium]MDG2155520.1 glutathione S-transferase N-terminal domain-containing protein [Gammaproteobacteria bacterium]